MRALIRIRVKHAALLAAILMWATPARAAEAALRRHTNQELLLHTNQESDVTRQPLAATGGRGADDGPGPRRLFWLSHLDGVRTRTSPTRDRFDLSVAVPRHGNSPALPPRGVGEVHSARTVPAPGTLVVIGWTVVLLRRSRRRA